MYIYEMRYNLKPGADINKLSSLFDELAAPLCRKIPGFLFCNTYQCSRRSEDESPEWDYLYIEAWENKEAYDKAINDKLIGMDPDSEISKTGLPQKLLPMIDKLSSSWGTLIYSTK